MSHTTQPAPSLDTWFTDWFHTPYYTLLYADRNETEADDFITHIYSKLHMKPGEKVLDVPCGEGRYARALHARGLQVTGVDVNPTLIARANNTPAKNVHFCVHDMRKPYAAAAFDYVLNLFTSLGYFKTAQENKATICAMGAALRSGGTLLIDFFNAHRVRRHFIPSETKKIGDVHFHLTRRIMGGCIQKNIEVLLADGKKLYFCERVMLLEEKHIVDYVQAAGLTHIATYGNYTFSPFDIRQSTRLILLAKKQ